MGLPALTPGIVCNEGRRTCSWISAVARRRNGRLCAIRSRKSGTRESLEVLTWSGARSSDRRFVALCTVLGEVNSPEHALPICLPDKHPCLGHISGALSNAVY
jgi:hypothetical protein